MCYNVTRVVGRINIFKFKGEPGIFVFLNDRKRLEGGNK